MAERKVEVTPGETETLGNIAQEWFAEHDRFAKELRTAKKGSTRGSVPGLGLQARTEAMTFSSAAPQRWSYTLRNVTTRGRPQSNPKKIWHPAGPTEPGGYCEDLDRNRV